MVGRIGRDDFTFLHAPVVAGDADEGPTRDRVAPRKEDCIASQLLERLLQSCELPRGCGRTPSPRSWPKTTLVIQSCMVRVLHASTAEAKRTETLVLSVGTVLESKLPKTRNSVTCMVNCAISFDARSKTGLHHVAFMRQSCALSTQLPTHAFGLQGGPHPNASRDYPCLWSPTGYAPDRRSLGA